MRVRSPTSSTAPPPARRCRSRHRPPVRRRAATTFDAVCAAADRLRRQVIGDTVTYVVTRNINYTNICYFRCQFCAFSKGKLSENLRGRPYNLDLDEIVAAQRGGLGARRHRGLPAGRHPPGIYRRDLSRGLPRDQGGAARHARARLLAARSLAGGQDARPHLARFPRRAARRRARLVARHRRRDPRRRGARGDLPRQGQDRRMAPGHGGGARRRAAQHGHDHVRPCRALRALGAAPAARPRACSSGPAASPNSCRCRSCRWRRRSR